jgi:SOS-response transcriptional repressor LexA
MKKTTTTTRKKRPPLTPAEEEVLTMILVGQRLHRKGLGIIPTIKEMQNWRGCRSHHSIEQLLGSLARKKYVRRAGNRAIETLEDP